MGKYTYTIAVILVILWAIGFLAYNSGALIHILLIVAAIGLLYRFNQQKKLP